MPPKKGGKAKKEPKEGDISKETMAKLKALDLEEFHEKSAAFVKIEDSLGKEFLCEKFLQFQYGEQESYIGIRRWILEYISGYSNF